LGEALCSLEDIPDGESRGFRYQEYAIIAVRQGQEVYLYNNSCPHLGVPLEWQPDQFLNADKTLIQCYTHGALFTIDEGVCISGPCHGDCLEKIPCHISNGQVVLSL
jgi:nitrite reductase/ring-hydroxylating ferredoxin subunit